MDKIQAQASHLWQRLSAPETGATYQQAALLTWDLLKETASLLWLLICLFLVAFEWFWKTSVQLGSDFRAWLSGIEQSSPDRVVSEAGRALLSAGKNSVGFTLSQAKGQLGLPVEQTALPTTSPAKPLPVSPSPEPYRSPSPASSFTASTPPSTSPKPSVQPVEPEVADDEE
jgi:hypothetical protein